MTGCFAEAGIPAAERGAAPEATLFAFERDFSGSLRCIPMIVRLKLDLAGVKLTLRQWSQLDRATRERLVTEPCDEPEGLDHYRARLIADLETQADEPAKLFRPDPSPGWSNSDEVAKSVADWCARLGCAPPSAAQWARLSALQRFALIKLTRPGHDNDNFYPAMIEFGLARLAND